MRLISGSAKVVPATAKHNKLGTTFQQEVSVNLAQGNWTEVYKVVESAVAQPGVSESWDTSLIDEPPLIGVSLELLCTILKTVNSLPVPACAKPGCTHEQDLCKTWTTGNVWFHFLKPLTEVKHFSVAELLLEIPETEKHPLLQANCLDVGPATVFVSHAWNGSFEDLVECLTLYANDPENNKETSFRFWVDNIVINQHRGFTAGFGDAFHNVIKNCERVACLLASWQDPTPLKRCWCLWEIMGSIEHRVDLKIILPVAQMNSLVGALVTDSESILNSLSTIDAANAQATVESDREMILRSIHEKVPGGILTVNSAVMEPLRNWLIQVCRKELEKLESNADAPRFDVIRFKLRLGDFLQQQSKYQESIALLDNAYKSAHEEYGEQHELTCECLHELGSVNFHVGNATEANDCLNRVIKVTLQVLGQDNPKTLKYQCSRATLLYSLEGKAKEAAELHKLVLEKRIKVLGEQDVETSDSMSSLALAYTALEEFTLAEKLYKDSIEIETKVRGASHPYTLAVIANLASMYYAQGKHAEALETYQTTLKDCRRVLGWYHKTTLTLVGNYAAALVDLNRVDEAYKLLMNSIRVIRHLYGKNHPCVLSHMNSLGKAYYSQQRYYEAVKVLKKAVKLCTDLYGAHNRTTIHCTSVLADVYYSMQDYDKADSLYRDLLARSRQVFGELHQSTSIRYKISIANLYTLRGDQPGGVGFIVDELKAHQPKESSEVLGVITLQGFLANFQAGMQLIEEAEQSAIKCFELAKELYGADNPEAYTFASPLSKIYMLQQRYDDVIQLSEEAIRISANVNGPTHNTTLKFLQEHGDVCFQQGEYETCAILYYKVYCVRGKLLGLEHPDFSSIAQSLGVVMFQLAFVLGKDITQVEEILKERVSQDSDYCEFLNWDWKADVEEISQKEPDPEEYDELDENYEEVDFSSSDEEETIL